mmetsp:Transcript_29351/g.95639  ORF Transcript_29351/g.95639 Transcript_29351/m.95639 type:complete len:339 (-) Transcript_29351:469-1485(-)
MTQPSTTACRMYEQRFPEIDSVVMVQVRSIAEMGAYVSLLEYNNIEGMILLSELSRRRIRSISKLIKVGRQEPVMVLRVDQEKGYIDLSKRRVSPEDVATCEERFNKSKMVHSIMRHVCENRSCELEELYQSVGWPLYRKYGHAFEAFKMIVADPEAVFSGMTKTVVNEAGEEEEVPAISEELKETLVKTIRRRMTPQPLKIRADVELTCFAYDGVLHIKDAMRAAEKASTEDCVVKMSLVASPLYVLTTQTLDKDLGVSVLTKGVENALEYIEAQKGKLVIKEPPRAVSERDDRLLAEKMKREEELLNADGDSSDEEQDESMGSGFDVEKTSGLVGI